jgi:methylated-DNA-protein-cysteine methyltransferase-like protein
MKSDSFFEKVYQVTQTIPPGRVTSYGAIARFLGAAGSARMVGWALNHSHAQPEFIPAHRVVNRNGLLTGKHHFHGPDVMESLLKSEGIEVQNDQVLGFRELFWDPSENLQREDFDSNPK